LRRIGGRRQRGIARLAAQLSLQLPKFLPQLPHFLLQRGDAIMSSQASRANSGFHASLLEEQGRRSCASFSGFRVNGYD
jgi:hypothetical protein